ncbi:vomeronasal type-2 receptor 26-like [Aquarana catesbeiana]|uniref:vomeronasal type-2 receptor 26-like n=1 Tax=Aquarana catesbeiana TaxID=8400 RepID=UPI003CC95BAE
MPSAPATRSCSSRDQGTQLSGYVIPDTTAASQASYKRSHSLSRSPIRPQDCIPTTSGTPAAPTQSLNDLQEVAADIKNILPAAILDLRADIRAISNRVVEKMTACHDASLCHVQQVTKSHAIHLRELQHHLEDLNNRGRRHNLRLTLESYYRAIQRLSVKVIILCGTYHDVIFQSSLRRLFRDVTLILSPNWASNIALIEKYPEVLNCSLSMNFLYEANKKFKNFVDGFHPMIHPKDKLLENLWMTTLFCLSGNKEKDTLFEKLYYISLHNCTGQEHLTDFGDYSSNRTLDPVYHTVQLMVYALHALHSSQNGSCLKGQADDREKCKHKLNRTLFTRTVGHFLTDAVGNRQVIINSTFIKWKTKDNQVPKSQCSESCYPGYRKVPGSSIQPCCHSCVLCAYGEISNVTDSKNCMKCPNHEWPNRNKTCCVAKQSEFLSFNDDMLSLVFIVVSLLCFWKTLVVLVIFILHQDTPIVKANNKSLSFVLLVSIMLGFLCVFLFLGRPVDVTCLLRQISFGILFTIAVSSVLAKTIMVCIAFKATKPNSVWKKWMGVKLPICIVLACSNVQVIICVSWLSISPPFQELDTHSYQEKIIIQCNEGSVIGFYSVLGYMGILAAVSFIIAFFARTLPGSFNEAKYITFSMLVFCSVWIAMIPAYLSTKGKYTVAVEIFAILISNNGLLYCIFLTKCFIILCRPELNTKGYLHSKGNI